MNAKIDEALKTMDTIFGRAGIMRDAIERTQANLDALVIEMHSAPRGSEQTKSAIEQKRHLAMRGIRISEFSRGQRR